MGALAVIDKIESVAGSPKTRFMIALAQSIPQGVGILPAALVRSAIIAIKGNHGLQTSTEISLFSSIAEVAQMGLSLDPHLGQAYMVPFYSSTEKANIATVMYGYRGLSTLARRSGEVTEIVGELRYAKDDWKLRLGSNRELIHVPADLPQSKRGAILGAYAIAELLHGRPVFEYMTVEEIDKIKNMVLKRKKEGGKPSPWETNLEEMMRKTPIRRIAKRLPQEPSLIPFVQAAIRDEYRDAGHSVRPIAMPDAVAEAVAEVGVIDVEPEPEEKKSTIKEDLKAKASTVVNGNEVADIYTLLQDYRLDGPDLKKAMETLGHKGKVDHFPKAKLAQLHGKLEEMKRS